MQINSIRKKLLALLRRSTFLNNVLTLVTGTAIAQAVGIALAIPLARLYTPSDFGHFAIFSSISAFAATIASLRYDLAIVLPKSDSVAKQVRRLARRCILLTSILTSLLCIAGADWVGKTYQSRPLTICLFFAGISVYEVAELSNVQYWLTRKTEYKLIAQNRVIQTTGVAVLQLGFFFLFPSVVGLFLGTITGQALALMLLLWKTRKDLRLEKTENLPSLRELAVRYRKMPLLNGPNVMVDALRNNGMNLIVGLSGAGVLGQFSKAQGILQVPMGFITASVTQVFYQRMSVVKPGEMLPLVKNVTKKLTLFAIPVFTLVFTLAPWLFVFLFGSQWDQAGYYARALTPWILVTVLTSPISNIFIVTETQERMLIFAIFYCAVPLAILFFSPLSMLTTIVIMSLTMAAMLLFMLAMAFKVAKKFDLGLLTRKPAT
ncbi:lipopolysaccharide biosynthesis protein [Varibaculum cambriense]|uniref:lipopolysaccharide biosynthesis protein n=1 Tax=Varibaculum cambriense TaxID=184870 RepID=UPI0028FF8841|nr:oligosaccharide flippase family protein [Varibaculum cambriense]MDU1223532.1 oligosaccharide flippase family protein [Varibaculum cambriense]